MTKLTDKDLRHAQRIAVAYLRTHEFLTNRIMRKIANISYDQAVTFFNLMLKRKVLKRHGMTAGTRYVWNRK